MKNILDDALERLVGVLSFVINIYLLQLGARFAMNDELIEQTISLLCAASPEKPWMTANYIARRIGRGADGKHIEQALLAHCRDTEDAGGRSLVRYSSLPSRKTLEVLWGAIQNVRPRSLENITQDKVADKSLAGIKCLERADVFLSHSHARHICSQPAA